MSSPLLLDGLLVADFTRVLAGPLCSQLLADAGARVIKVEEPEKGDETRRWGPPFREGVSAYFLSVNRNKESLALDLKRDGDVVRRLIERADVVLDNFLPRQRAALLGDVRVINPRAVHCSISGYDADTPDAGTPGYDLLAQAGAGLMSITGEADGEPMKVGVALADVLTAHYAFGAVCAALVARVRTGNGASIEVSLFSATLASLVNIAQSALMTGKEARRYGNAHPSIVPYQLFHGRDRAFALGAGTDRHFEQLCREVIGRPELLADERFATNEARVSNREALIPMLEETFADKAAEEWVDRCRKAAIPASLVQGVHEALRSENGRVLIEEVEHERIGSYEAVRNPVRVNGERMPIRSAPPEIGEDTEKILRELGFSARATS
ncbi:MAG TPA: CoA transferase [Thermoanaerobaculia bacterium]|nr:CoA transferase [Thermoanaerobaculia bacterium]